MGIITNSVWNKLIILLPIVGIWLISCLAETNRTPFDFAEGESEPVSGFNVWKVRVCTDFYSRVCKNFPHGINLFVYVYHINLPHHMDLFLFHIISKFLSMSSDNFSSVPV